MDLMSTKGTQTPRDVGVRSSPWMAKMRRSSAAECVNDFETPGCEV